jgi:hypothetical protein
LIGFVHTATLRLDEGADPRAPGGAVTVALCGHWEHDGPCRWPHHTGIDAEGDTHLVRTVAAAPPQEEGDVRRRIHDALAGDGRWTVLSDGPGRLTEDEVALTAGWAATESA